jgi:hypothetical protein
MKRSEAVFELQKSIYVNTQQMVSVEDASQILKDLEDIGMRYTIEDGHGNQYRFRVAWEWEKEDAP